MTMPIVMDLRMRSIKNEVHLTLQRCEATAVVLIDRSVAFYAIDHGMLIDCLNYWFGVVVLDWLKSYLADPSQCIRIGSILSNPKKLLYEVLKGFALGPILFSL